MKKKDINKVTSQLNILPTVANLLNLEYHPNYYLMPDAFDNKYKGLVFFSDYSWYDGNVYVDNGKVTNGKNISEQELEEKNNLVNKLIKINDTVLTTDYFKNVKSLQSWSDFFTILVDMVLVGKVLVDMDNNNNNLVY